MRDLARRVAASGTGARFLRWAARGPALAVLVYHRVLPVRGRDPWSLVVTEERLEEQLAFLCARFPVLPLGAALARLEEGALHEALSVALTFDDGSRDLRVHAVPILARHGVPATLFLPTGLPGEPFWWNQLDRAERAGALRADPPGRRPGEPVAHALRRLDGETRRRYLAAIPERHRLPADDLELCLSWDEIHELPPGIELGGHGHAHLSLGLAPSDVMERDVASCAQALRQHLPVARPLFAYPFGAPEDVGALAPDAVRQAGFAAAFTTTPGLVRARGDRWRLPRVWVHDEGAGSLAVRLLRIARAA